MMNDISAHKEGQGKYALPSGLYDVAKDAATIYLPASATLYVVLAGIWGWPFGEQITATVAGLVTFLGTVLKISTVSYNRSDKSTDGTLIVDVDEKNPMKDRYLFDINTDLAEVADKDRITLKINNLTEKTLSSMDPRNVVNKSDSQK